MSILNKLANWLDQREVVALRRELACLRETNRLMGPRWDYLNSRDALCSQMANTIARLGFEVEKLKGAYKNPKDAST